MRAMRMEHVLRSLLGALRRGSQPRLFKNFKMLRFRPLFPTLSPKASQSIPKHSRRPMVRQSIPTDGVAGLPQVVPCDALLKSAD